MQDPSQHVHATINPAPSGTKRFEVHDMRRIPVVVSEQAREIIDGSTQQGRLLPQALSEFFGTLPDAEQVEVNLVKDTVFGERLAIHVKHGNNEDKHHRFFIAKSDLFDVHSHPALGFGAARTADELLRLYRVHTLKEGQ